MKNKQFIYGIVLGIISTILIISYVFITQFKKIEKKHFELDISKIEISKNERKFNVKSFINNKDGLIINFWATWCKPCIKEFPIFDKLKEENIKIIAISNEDEFKIQEFKKNNYYSFELLKYDFIDNTKINILPTTILINKEGKIIWSKIGSVTNKELIIAISLLK